MLSSSKKSLFSLLFVLLFLTVSSAYATVLTRDTVWHGDVTITEDILVPAGVTLTIQAGSKITFSAAENTKTDPEYLSSLTELTIRGTLNIEGNERSGVLLSSSGKAGNWAGVILDGGTAVIRNCQISAADTAIQVFAGKLELQDSRLTGNHYGVLAQGSASQLKIRNSHIRENDYGLFAFSGAIVDRQATSVEGNRKQDLYESSATPLPPFQAYKAATLTVTREYGDEVLAGETVWQGRVQINGVIRIPEGGRLIILPGTIVEFSRKDTNHDGIGENGLLIQGRLLAKGARQAPIFFRSAEKQPRMGDWDAINIMNSDGGQNLIEYCQVEDAYRGAHFHFSNISITNSVFLNNYRSIQFQESAVELHDNWVYNNKSGIQGRDSSIVFNDNLISGNYDGANFYRVHFKASGNRFVGNRKEGLRLRESIAEVDSNLIDGNRFGLLVADTFQGSFDRNVISANSEIGLSIKNVDNLELAGNFFTKNGINGLNIQEARLTIKGNLFAGNGQRGIGIISFSGLLSNNNFADNGLFAVDYEGTTDLPAPDNWWGGVPEKVIGDKRIDAKRGRLLTDKPSEQPHQIEWPLKEIASASYWSGAVAVTSTLLVAKPYSLTISPGSRVLFSDGTGLTVQGRLTAVGEPGRPITFTARTPKEEPSWEEIILEYAEGSRVAYCIFENATWGLHSHFTNLEVTHSLFRKNFGGMRFRSGPMLIRDSVFTGNTIGIRSYRGNAVVKNNLITDNETGIFVREKGSGLKVAGNNLAGNRTYAMRCGDFNDEDVSAADNWWGPGDPSQSIFDARNEPGIGTIRFEPYLTGPPQLKEVGL